MSLTVQYQNDIILMSEEKTFMLQEKELKALPGWPMVALLLTIPVLSVLAFIWSINAGSGYGIGAAIVVFIVDLVCLGGFAVINPNEAKVVQLFGVYKGTIKQPGFWWVNPLTRRRRVSLRVRNFESSRLKVNDQDANPIEIASVIVWRVIETPKPSSTWMTSSITYTCKARAPYAPWRLPIPTTPTWKDRCR